MEKEERMPEGKSLGTEDVGREQSRQAIPRGVKLRRTLVCTSQFSNYFFIWKIKIPS